MEQHVQLTQTVYQQHALLENVQLATIQMDLSVMDNHVLHFLIVHLVLVWQDFAKLVILEFLGSIVKIMFVQQIVNVYQEHVYKASAQTVTIPSQVNIVKGINVLYHQNIYSHHNIYLAWYCHSMRT